MTAAPILSKTLWKTCTGCGNPKPIAEFKGIKANWCEQCRQDYGKPGKKPWPSQRTDRLKQALVKLVGELSGGQAEAVTITAVANGLMAEYKGLGNFLREWYEDIQEARSSERKSHKVILDSKLAIARLIAMAEERRPKFAMGSLGDQELDDLVYGLMLSRIESGAGDEALSALAASKGFKLVPAEETDALTIEYQEAAHQEPIQGPQPEGVPEFEEATDATSG